VKRVTPEEIEGVRRLLSERPLGGLRPVEIPRAVLDRLAEAFFGLAELQEASGALVAAIQDRHGDAALPCGVCDDLALTLTDDGKARCAEHPNGGRDLSYAPAWRRFVGLLEKP
jgi:hypothetical protein